MTKLLERFRGHRPDSEALSAYLDGRLDATATAALDAHLPGCEACTTRLRELRGVRETLSAMPEAEVARSFRLRVADVERAPRAPAPSPWMRFAPAAGGLALVVFAVLVGVDLAGSDGDDRSATSGARSAGEAVMGYEPPEASESAFDAGPPVDGDAASGATQSQPEADVTVAADAAARAPSPAESGEDATKREMAPGPTPGVGQVQPDAVSADEELASPEQAAEDGSEGVDGLRIAQVAAAAVAIAAAGVSVWWFRRRSEVL